MIYKIRLEVNAAELAQSQTGGVLGGRYLLLSVIGVGGMGAVFEAEHTLTKRRVALKLIHPHLVARSAKVAARFIREAQASAAVQHPAIVEVLDGGQDPDGRLFLVFELLQGVTLGEALKDKLISPLAAVPVSINVLDGLAALHAKGLVHRDIKPENVFLVNRSPERVKLLDFGIAKHIADERQRPLTSPGAIVGTARYMSPEQALGAAVDGRADIWAVGATLYRAFAGPAALSARPILPLATVCKGVSQRLALAIDRALKIDPKDRWQTATRMREELEAIDLTAEASIETPLPSAPEPTELSATTPAPPNSISLRAGAALAWIAIIVTVALLLLGQQEKEAPSITVMEKAPEVSLPEPPPLITPPATPSAAPPPVRKKVKKKQAEKRQAEKKIESPWSQPKRQL